MDRLFELCAELTMDTAAFIRSVNQAEQTARQMQALLDRSNAQSAAGLVRLQGTAGSVWQSITRSIQAAINKTHEFLNIQGVQQITLTVQGGPAVAMGMTAPDARASGAALDTQALAGALAEALSGMRIDMDGEAVGLMSAEGASQQIRHEARKRRFNP